MPIELSKLTADPVLQDEGKWFEYGDPKDEVAFHLSYIGNKSYIKKRNKLFADARRKNRNRDLPPEMEEALVNEAMIGTVLRDWRGINHEGTPFEFSRDNAIRFLSLAKEARDFIMIEATVLENFQLPTGDDTSTEDQPSADLKSGVDVGVAEQSQAGDA